MADTQGIVSGPAGAHVGHPSFWSWILNGEQDVGLPAKRNGSNGNGLPAGYGSANGNADVNGNGHVNGNGNGHVNGNGDGHKNGNGRVATELALEGMTPTGLARRLARR